MIKETYETPELEIILFLSVVDVITTSVCPPQDGYITPGIWDDG